MDGLGTYILSITAAAVLCTLSIEFAGKTGTLSAILRLVCGIIMASVVIRPLGDLWVPDLSEYFEDLDAQVTAAVMAGTNQTREELARCISEECCTYIQDKAKELGASLSVYVELDDSTVPVPIRIILEGEVSPSARSRLEIIIAEDIGIGKEDQIWKSNRF